MTWRDDVLEGLRKEPKVPVLILGGGVNGTGLFRELSLQGVRCLLIDKSDFVAGASSKSSRMIHGGLRYLENRELKLVRESLAERNRLLENAPHYVSPLKTTIPLFSWLGGLLRCPLLFLGLRVRPGGRGALIVKVGLSVYDFLSRKGRRTPTHFLSSRRESRRQIPGLHPDVVSTATYWDAFVTQAERLCIELIQDGCRRRPESRALNYVDLEGTASETVRLRDQSSGETVTIEPAVVVNATGAWVDITNAQLGLETRFIGGTKGSHLVVDNAELYDALGDRMIYYEHQDGRVCIAFRFMDRVIMGSTDISVENPDWADCDDDEIEYMFTTVRGVLPELGISRDDVVYKFCGVRPLPATDDSVPGRISRDHRIEVLAPDDRRRFPVVSLIGGKWTTFRAFAEQTTDRVLSLLGERRHEGSERLPIGGGRDFPAGDDEKRHWVERVSASSGLSSTRVGQLLDRYGTAAADYIESLGGEPETPLATLSEYCQEEIRHVVAHEYVEHLVDLICRRSLIAILGLARREVLEEIAAVMASVLGWDAGRVEIEVRHALRDVTV